jgi:hypothetical protein
LAARGKRTLASKPSVITSLYCWDQERIAPTFLIIIWESSLLPWGHPCGVVDRATRQLGARDGTRKRRGSRVRTREVGSGHPG